MSNNQSKVNEFHCCMDMPSNLSVEDNVSTYNLRLTLIEEELAEMNAELTTISQIVSSDRKIPEGNKAGLLKEMADVLYVIYGFADTFGLNLDEAFNRVHASNMSKLVDGKPLKRDDGKVLKGPNYTPPDLRTLVGVSIH